MTFANGESAEPRAPSGESMALSTILRDPLLMRAGAWLGGFFKLHPRSSVRPPFDGEGFRERLSDTPVPDWPYPRHDPRSRAALDHFVQAGLLITDGDGSYREVEGRNELLMALLHYDYRDVEDYAGRIPHLGEAAKGSRVLDAGCGAGAYSLYFRDLGAGAVIALDSSQERLRVTQTLAFSSGGGVLIVRGSIERLPLPDASVDLIHCRVVLPYTHQRRTIGEFARVLSSGGRALLMLHAASFYRWQLREFVLKPRNASPAVLALLGIAGGAAFSALGWEPHWWTGHDRFYLSYQGRQAFSDLVKSCGLRIETWDPNGRKPIVWLTKTA